jgi:hypothetical protein
MELRSHRVLLDGAGDSIAISSPGNELQRSRVLLDGAPTRGPPATLGPRHALALPQRRVRLAPPSLRVGVLATPGAVLLRPAAEVAGVRVEPSRLRHLLALRLARRVPARELLVANARVRGKPPPTETTRPPRRAPRHRRLLAALGAAR